MHDNPNYKEGVTLGHLAGYASEVAYVPSTVETPFDKGFQEGFDMGQQDRSNEAAEMEARSEARERRIAYEGACIDLDLPYGAYVDPYALAEARMHGEDSRWV